MCLSTLKEVSLHQQNLEGINRALTRLCPELEILYLQHNLIGCLIYIHFGSRWYCLNLVTAFLAAKIENLRRLKDLDYLNLVRIGLNLTYQFNLL